jgi:hypothetical protein
VNKNHPLYELALGQFKRSFVDEYVENTLADPGNIWSALGQGLGLMVSHLTEWGGEEAGAMLIYAMREALENSNWHTEAAVLYDMTAELEKGATIAQVLGIGDEKE